MENKIHLFLHLYSSKITEQVAILIHISSFFFFFLRFLLLNVFMLFNHIHWSFPGGLAVKNLPSNAGYSGSIPGSGRLPAEGNGYPLQSSCLENPTDKGAS